MESRLGTIAVPILNSSSTLLPLTMNPLAVSRWPLTDMFPALRSPEGGVLVQPDITTAFGCCELMGTTPACIASKSVKLRPFRGVTVISLAEMVSPNWRVGGVQHSAARLDHNALTVRRHNQVRVHLQRASGVHLQAAFQEWLEARCADRKLVTPRRQSQERKGAVLVTQGFVLYAGVGVAEPNLTVVEPPRRWDRARCRNPSRVVGQSQGANRADRPVSRRPLCAHYPPSVGGASALAGATS